MLRQHVHGRKREADMRSTETVFYLGEDTVQWNDERMTRSVASNNMTVDLVADELQWALAVDPDCARRSLDECRASDDFIDNDTIDRRIRTLSCGLAEIIPSSDARIVQFTHQSVKDVFVESGLRALDKTKPERVVPAAHWSRVDFGIFGGYAIGTMGGARESKDIDCLASVIKEQIISLLDNKEGFQAISQSRQDYVAFLWSDRPDRSHAVLVEIFCEQFPGAQYSMMDVPRSVIPIEGLSLGQGSSFFLDPFYLFKGKLRAAATRGKFHDSADLRMLGGKYKTIIEARAHELNVPYLGLALKRYPELERLFQQLGIDVEQAKHATKDLDLSKLPAPTVGDVQRGLLE
ncbi:hypothetical protein ACJZ2D_016934 [Fusarium nematophilum]